MKIYLLLLWLPLAALSQHEATIDNGNSKLHFTTFGAGKPLLVINGVPGMNSEALQGKNDSIKVATAQQIANAFPNSKLVLIDNFAHYGWFDAAEIYFKAIKSFLNS